MPARAFDGIEVLLIDGNNLLHRVVGAADAGALRSVLPRLSAAVPASVATVLMLDGHPATGAVHRDHVRPIVEIRHAGSITADDALLDAIRDTPADARHAITIVTDDIALSNRARLLGARTQRLAWLEQLIERPPRKRASIGAGRQVRESGARERTEDEAREPWRPGRGATRKIGNPRRSARSRRLKGPGSP
jgi:hypothetical protein